MIISFLLSVIIVIFLITTYNRLIKNRNNVQASFSTVDVMLKKRHDLIPNLVASVKSIMNHEKSLLEKVTSLRSEAVQANNFKEKEKVENALSSLLGQLQVTMENYPEVKADKNVLQLQAALNDVEEQISASRRIYNNAVKRYNNSIQTAPSNIIAHLFSFKAMDFFEVALPERENVNVEQMFKS